MDFLKRLTLTMGGRMIGAAAAAAAAKIGEATGQIVDPASLTALALFVYATVHRYTSKVTNPSDAASSQTSKIVNADTGHG